MVLSPYNISYKRFQQKDAYDGYEILKNKCLIQNYFNGTILTTDVNLNATFHKPTTVQTCLPHLDHENIALSTSNITTLFFSLPRYAILLRVTTAPPTTKIHHTAEASIHSRTQQSTLYFLLMCFGVVFVSNDVVLFGQRVPDCDDDAAM
jgi:hypothetical protein